MKCILHTLATGVQWPHVKNIHALHLAQDLQPLQTRRLLNVGGNCAGRGARREEIGLGRDLCKAQSISPLLRPPALPREWGKAHAPSNGFISDSDFADCGTWAWESSFTALEVSWGAQWRREGVEGAQLQTYGGGRRWQRSGGRRRGGGGQQACLELARLFGGTCWRVQDGEGEKERRREREWKRELHAALLLLCAALPRPSPKL